jgi:hypothetical protein
MEKVKIQVYGAERFHDYLLDCSDTENDYSEEREFILSIKDGFEVETAKEYLDMLEKISEITDGDYSIWNCGKTIDLWVD